MAGSYDLTEGRAPRCAEPCRGVVVARRVGERTELARAHATSPLRFLHPTFAAASSKALCLVSFGGGLVDGDAIDLDVVVEPGATLVLFTQSSTKVFRGSARQSLRAEVHGTLLWLPDPVACFAGARYEQRVTVDVHGAGSCLLFDGYTSGRAAYGERWAFEELSSRTTIRCDGVPVVTDAVTLAASDEPVERRMRRHEAFGALMAFGDTAMRALRPGVPLAREGAFVVDGPLPTAPDRGRLTRFAATGCDRLLSALRERLGNLHEIGVVDPFSARY